MGKIPEEAVERIREEARIYDVVSDFITLRKKGNRWMGLCPFHADRHQGNFVVYPKKNCYKCFACGAKGGPIEFLMNLERLSFPDAIRWLGKKYNIETDMSDFKFTPRAVTPPPPPLPLLELPFAMVVKRQQTMSDNLCNWIRTGIAWDDVQRGRIEDVLVQYHVGHTLVQGRYDFTIFWQIDEQQRVRTGHLMRYKEDGHRHKAEKEDTDTYSQDWIHSMLTRKRNDSDPWPYPGIYNPDKQEHQCTLFGLHLLNEYPNATVNIVESEKTAVLMAIAYGNHPMQVWMASCGMQNITRERLEPIISQGRKIILYPDRDGIEAWKAQADRLRYDKVFIDEKPVTKWWKPCDGEKADIADVVIRHLNEHAPRPRTAAEVVRRYPQTRELVERMDLEVMPQ